LLHPEGYGDLVALGGDVGVDLIEEAHGVNGADVLVEHLAIERLAGLGLEVDRNGVLLDPDVAAHAHLRHRRTGFRARTDRSEERGDDGEYGGEPAVAPHASLPVRETAGPRSSCRRPSARRSVRSMAPASRSLCVATTSAAPCSRLSASRSACTSSPVA